MRKKPKLENDESTPSTPEASSKPVSSNDNTPQYTPAVPLPGIRQLAAPNVEFHNRYDWQQPPRTAGSDTTNASRHTEQTNVSRFF